LFQNQFGILVSFTSQYNDESWILTSVYAPCTLEGKRDFKTGSRRFKCLMKNNDLL